MGKRNNRKRKLISTSDSSSSNVSTVSLGVSSELEFNHSWNRYDKRNNPKKTACQVNYQKQTDKVNNLNNDDENNRTGGEGKGKQETKQ